MLLRQNLKNKSVIVLLGCRVILNKKKLPNFKKGVKIKRNNKLDIPIVKRKGQKNENKLQKI